MPRRQPTWDEEEAAEDRKAQLPRKVRGPGASRDPPQASAGRQCPIVPQGNRSAVQPPVRLREAPREASGG
eukprot:1994753-Lingulodinium_polyedra.AAC.1